MLVTEYQANYRRDNKARITELSRLWRERHRERLRKLESFRRREKGEEIRAKDKIRNQSPARKAYIKSRNRIMERYRTDPSFRVKMNLRRRVYAAIKGRNKAASTIELLGCPIVWLEVHLESLFRPGMTWENYGSVWHVDHVKPCSAFNLIDSEQQRACFHWTNLQPLFAKENLQKSDKYPLTN